MENCRSSGINNFAQLFLRPCVYLVQFNQSLSYSLFNLTNCYLGIYMCIIYNLGIYLYTIYNFNIQKKSSPRLYKTFSETSATKTIKATSTISAATTTAPTTSVRIDTPTVTSGQTLHSEKSSPGQPSHTENGDIKTSR